ncbi:MAG: apolipoprotein N-acyltransferase [Nitrospirae bacterium]|nr:apolipoprotein N-acyltransferase [Nitrospirota bacterium]
MKKTDILFASASGILLGLGFPQFNLYPLAWAALVPLFAALRDKNTKSAFYLGLLAGLIYFLGTIYWVYHSMYFYGGVPLILSILLLILLSLSQALYVGAFAVLFNFLSKRSSIPALFIAPVLWVTIEYIRTYTIFNFPWSILGYSQYKFLPLIQISDITGVYGISFLVAAFNGAIYDAAVLWPKKSDETPLAARWPHALSIIILVSILISSLFYGMGKLKETDKGRKIRVSVIQGNVEQDKKWDSKFQTEVIDKYKRLSIKAASDNPDIIVWPESALPFVFEYHKTLTEELVAFQKQLNRYLLFGSVMSKVNTTGNNQLSNSAVLLSPDGSIKSVYDKIHLVPYGEYVPLRDLFPFVGKLVTAIGDFIMGEETTVMETTVAKIGPLICYEIIFPGLVRQFVDKGANVLVTITNDAWFGRTAAAYQHFSMAVFRAVENRVPVARAANTGISGFFDSRGRIINKSNLFVETILTEEISVGDKKSFYTKHGDIFAWFCITSSVLMIIFRLFFTKGKNN